MVGGNGNTVTGKVGGMPEPKKHLVLPKLESVVATLTGLMGAADDEVG